MSPLKVVLSGNTLRDPPNNKQDIAFFISIFPYIALATDPAIFSYILGSYENYLNFSSSSNVNNVSIFLDPNVYAIYPNPYIYGVFKLI